MLGETHQDNALISTARGFGTWQAPLSPSCCRLQLLSLGGSSTGSWWPSFGALWLCLRSSSYHLGKCCSLMFTVMGIWSSPSAIFPAQILHSGWFPSPAQCRWSLGDSFPTSPHPPPSALPAPGDCTSHTINLWGWRSSPWSFFPLSSQHFSSQPQTQPWLRTRGCSPQLLPCTLWLPGHDKLCTGSVICVSSNFPLIHLYILDGKHSPGAAINHGAAGATQGRPASRESLEHAERRGPGQDSNPVDALVRGGRGVWEQVQPFPGVLPAPAQPSQCRDRQEPELCAGHQAGSGQWPLPKTSPWVGLFGGKHPGLLWFALLQPPCTPGLCFVPWCNPPALIFSTSYP